jgi:membrane protease subunit HflC
MRLIAVLIPLAVLVVGIVGPQIFFTVDETQAAIVTRFGQPQSNYTIPGLKYKVPFIDSVVYFDKRRTLFDAEPDSFLTSDKKRLLIDAYAIGRIVDPLQFFKTVRTAGGADTRGKDIVVSDLKIEIANDLQTDVIGGNRVAIMQQVTQAVRPKLWEFGIQVVDVRLKRADFPPQIANSIFANMEAERKRIANAERAEGAKADLEKRAEVDRRAIIIQAEAQRDADIIRGEGEAESIRIYAEALKQDPEFFAFQRSLEAYKIYLPRDTAFYGSPENFGQWFEDIRLAVSEAAKVPGNGAGSAESSPDQGGLNFDSEEMLVETAARQLLAREFGIPVEGPTRTRFEAISWSDSSLGCPEDGKLYAQAIVSGFSLDLKYDGTLHEVHSNGDGSMVVTCTQ